MLIYRSVLICRVNVTLKAKSALHISQFVRRMAAVIYYTTVGLEKCNTQRNRETKRETNKQIFQLMRPL